MLSWAEIFPNLRPKVTRVIYFRSFSERVIRLASFRRGRSQKTSPSAMAAPSNPTPTSNECRLPAVELSGNAGGGLIGVSPTIFKATGLVDGAGSLVGTTGAGLVTGGGTLAGGFLPMMMSGCPTTTGAGGGVLVGFGAGGGGGNGKGGNPGMFTSCGGKLAVQPTYWPSCERSKMTSG